MPALTLYERVLVGLFDVLDQEGFSDKTALANQKHLNLEDATLGELGIGGAPIGLGELLDLRVCLERKFNVQFDQAELPDYLQSPSITLKQIAEAIVSKIEAKASASNTAA